MTIHNVQVSYACYWSYDAQVEAKTVDEACDKAIEEANQNDGWRSIDHVGDTFVDAVSTHPGGSPWDSSLPVPAKQQEFYLHAGFLFDALKAIVDAGDDAARTAAISNARTVMEKFK